jgi:hypothetical protein
LLLLLLRRRSHLLLTLLRLLLLHGGRLARGVVGRGLAVLGHTVARGGLGLSVFLRASGKRQRENCRERER